MLIVIVGQLQIQLYGTWNPLLFAILSVSVLMADLFIYSLMFRVIFALRLYPKCNMHVVLMSLILLLIPRP